MTAANMNMAQWKMAFGFLLLICITSLAAMIALGKVHQYSSYGLPEIEGGLLTLAGGFANWAFGESRSSAASAPAADKTSNKNSVTEGAPLTGATTDHT